jgi:potassium efflux system protein
MRHTKWLISWLTIVVVLSAGERGIAQQRPGSFITRQPVSRVFSGRSRLLVSRRPNASLFNVTDFFDSMEMQDWEPANSSVVPASYEPVEPEPILLVVPAPMTFTEEAIRDAVPLVLPAINPGTPGRSQQPATDIAVPLLPTKPVPNENFQHLFDEAALADPLPVEPIPATPVPPPHTAPEPSSTPEPDETNGALQGENEFGPNDFNPLPERPPLPVRAVTLQTVTEPQPTDPAPAMTAEIQSDTKAPSTVEPNPFDQKQLSESLFKNDNEQDDTLEVPVVESFSDEPAFDDSSIFEEPIPTPPAVATSATEPTTGLLTEPITGPLTESVLRQQVAALEGTTSVAPEERAAAIESYNQAIDWLAASEKARFEADRIEQRAAEIPRQVADTTVALEQMKATEPAAITADNTTAAQLQGYGQKLRAAVAKLQQNRDELLSQLEQIEQRSQTAGDSKTEMLDAIELAEQFTTDKTGLQAQAAGAEAVARATMLRNQLALAGVHERTDAATVELTEVRIATVDLQLERANAQLAAVQQAVDTIQEAQAAEEAARIKAIAEQVPAELKPFADDNAVIAEQLRTLKSQLSETRAETAKAKVIHTRVGRSFDRVRKIQDRTGLNTTLGLILNHELEHLPSPRRWKRLLSGIKDQLHDLSETEFAIERRNRERDVFAANVGRMVERLAATMPERREIYEKMGREITKSHITLLNNAEATAQEYSEALTNFDGQCEQLVHTIHDFESHINKNVLWIRSNEPLGVSDFAAFSPMAMHFGDANLWVRSADSVLAAVQENLAVLAVMAFLVLVVVAFGDELRSRLKRTGDRASADDRVRLLPTWEAVAITCLLAFAWPAFLWTLGWSISNSLTSTGLALACGAALQTSAMWFGAFTLPRCICMPDGLAHRHFGWRESALAFIHQGLPKIMRWGLPIVAMVAVLSGYEHGKWSGNAGRILFIFGALGLAYYVRRALDTKTGVIAKCLSPESFAYRVRGMILAGGVIAVLTLAVTSAAGYHHSALRLTHCLQETWMTAIGLAVLFGLMVRALDWVTQSFDSSRSLAPAPQKLQQFDPNSEEIQEATTKRELAHNHEQVHRFLQFATVVTAVLCCWGIWHNVLPALNVVNDIHLWSMTKEVPVVADTAQAGAAVQAIKQSVPVTLGDLIRAMIVLVVTIAAARSLPGLLDTLVLMRLPLDRGGRHAVATISRYLLITVGMLLTLKQVGVDWASLQWMVAAMTVGLGFGLQEIFANFVSGLIILLERPIRLGDFVTVNGETGFVTRIQFRATTITDLDRRELLVPNKKFITDELINWTLSDPITRLVVPVGIAYGSDTSMAHQLLLEVAAEHPIVLKEPESTAIMTAFGDSTLNFELRVFIPRRDEFSQITHELNTAIDRKFRGANIEIAFPQCDINVRGLEQLANVAKRAA